MEKQTFLKYEKSTNDSKVLLIYLLLNNYSIAKIKRIEEIEESRLFGVKVRKLYGVTEEYVDIAKIEREIEAIQSPIICSRQSYEYYSDEPVIYTYTPQMDAPLFINDLNVVSRIMCIGEDYVVSSNEAKDISQCKESGFMYFYNYVLYDEMTIWKWRLKYENKVFSIYYTSTNLAGEQNEELMFSAIEIDKTSTYKLTLYIIKKAIGMVEEFPSDNFVTDKYTLINKR